MLEFRDSRKSVQLLLESLHAMERGRVRDYSISFAVSFEKGEVIYSSRKESIPHKVVEPGMGVEPTSASFVFYTAGYGKRARTAARRLNRSAFGGL